MRSLLLMVPALGLGVFLAGRTSAARRTQSDPVLAGKAKVGNLAGMAGRGTPLRPAAGNELAAFSMGCFWGTEEVFRHLKGVTATSVGYTGGNTLNPTYEQVGTETTNHAETALVEYDPKRISYATLLKVFWENHDSTSGDRQGPDVGSSYRSAIWTIGPEQAALAARTKAEFQTKLTMPITTQVAPLGRFWLAESYHQQYHEKTKTASCPFPRPPKKAGP